MEMLKNIKEVYPSVNTEQWENENESKKQIAK